MQNIVLFGRMRLADLKPLEQTLRLLLCII